MANLLWSRVLAFPVHGIIAAQYLETVFRILDRSVAVAGKSQKGLCRVCWRLTDYPEIARVWHLPPMAKRSSRHLPLPYPLN
jgi:hypothetical protein